MIIHVVQPGDTIASIAEKYGVTVERLILDNSFKEPFELVLGQTVVIAYPEKTYTVQDGDTLQKIADQNNITLIQLLRNNPYLAGREYIYPGETLIISYDNNKGKITTYGYVNPYIAEDTLIKTLPYLSYISIFGYRTTMEANIIGIDDTDIINLAKEYQVAPIMMLSSFSEQGGLNPDVIKFLYNENMVEKHINDILIILQRKGYCGVNLTFQFISEENREIYENYTKKLSERLKQDGYCLYITISENYILDQDKISFEKFDLTEIGRLADGIIILNYNWGYSFGPPGPVASIYMMRQFYDYIVKMIPPEKIDIGVPIIGYDWELPYIIGVTRANSLTLDSVITLAGNTGSTILFDEASQTPYFRYIDNRDGIPRRHIVWFIDARTIDAVLNLVTEYGFKGTGIWNIMNYDPQMWLIMNSEYEIETALTDYC